MKQTFQAKYIYFLFTIVFSILGLTTNAQTEQWDTYMAKFGNKPGSVLVNMGYKEAAPDNKYPFLVITGPKALNCNSQGFPDKEEIDRLEEILDATNNFITGVTAKALVGTLTYNCERLNYYYVKDTTGIRNAIMRLYNRNYKNYNYAINMKADKEWSTYLTFLYPDEKTLIWMDNDKLITKMLNNGDDLTKQRDINFDLYFKTDSGRNTFVGFVVSKGYKTDTSITSASHDYLYELKISKFGPVKMDAINSMTEELKNELKKYNSFYNSWEAPLVSPLKK